MSYNKNNRNLQLNNDDQNEIMHSDNYRSSQLLDQRSALPITPRRTQSDHNVIYIKRFPYVTIICIFVNWFLFLYGIFSSGDELKVTLNSPLSPPYEVLQFLYVDFWPSCGDLRYQYWRLISMQYVHLGLAHILTNSVAGLVYGCVFECHYAFGSLGVLVIYELSIVFGSLGHAYIWPYEIIIGCSAGVYGIIGSCLSLVIIDKKSMNPTLYILLAFTLFAQLVSDITTIIFFQSSNVAYAAHISGYVFGFSIGLLSNILKRKQTKNKIILSVIGLGLLITQSIILIRSYVNNWPPKIITTPLRRKSAAQSCCSNFFDLNVNYNEYDRNSYYSCVGSTLVNN